MNALGNVFPILVSMEVLAISGASANHVDLRKHYVSPGKRELMATFTAVATTTTTSLSVLPLFYENSVSTTVGASAITGGAFTAATPTATASALQTIWFGTSPSKPWIYVEYTFAGTQAVSCIEVFAVKRNS